MFCLNDTMRYHLCSGRTDIRKGISLLIGVVKEPVSRLRRLRTERTTYHVEKTVWHHVNIVIFYKIECQVAIKPREAQRLWYRYRKRTLRLRGNADCGAWSESYSTADRFA